MKKAVVILVTVIIASSCSLFEKPSMTQEEIDVLLQEKASLQEDLVNLQQEHELLKLKSEECATMLAELRKEEEETTIGKYSVILGSFKNMKYAEDYAVKVKGWGGLGEIIPGPYNFNLVVHTTHSTLKDAAQSMYTARENLTDEAWIFMNR